MSMTLVALLFAHVAADFVIQSRAMVASKHRVSVFGLHIGLVALTAALALGVAVELDAVLAVAAIAFAHAAIDAIKTWAVPKSWLTDDTLAPLELFVVDQGAHLISIGLVAFAWPTLFSAGWWSDALGPQGALWLLRSMVVVTGVVTTTRVGALVIGLLMDGLSKTGCPPTTAAAATPSPIPIDHRDIESVDIEAGTRRARELRAGVWIGWLERSLVFTFVWLDQFNAIGLVIAAKSILRFEYARKSAQSELVIIGTLASFGWAVGSALLTRLGLWSLS